MSSVVSSSLHSLLLLASWVHLRRVVEFGRRSDRLVDEVERRDFLNEREELEGGRRRRLVVVVCRRRKGKR